ncbi:MAG: DEAD/DEAH box helicase [Deltaproteobacteria bacterium]|nr:DEAD/DEAH box helicase [Deltaproteobacteria bacterium]
MARRETLPRQELLQLLEQPAVDAGFRGAAARYLPHLEAGARLGSASVVRGVWRLTLRDLAERALHHGAGTSTVPVVRLFYDKYQEAAFVELLLRWARRLSSGEVSASPAAALEPTEVPLHDKGALIAWATKHGVVELLEVELSALGVLGKRLTVGEVLARQAKAPQLLPDEALLAARAFLAREARVVVPPVPTHERPPFRPELVAFAEAVAAERALLPPGRSPAARVGLDSHHKPPIIFLDRNYRQHGVEVASPVAGIKRFISHEDIGEDMWGQVLDGVLDLLAWPSRDELDLLVRALTPQWAELLRALARKPSRALVDATAAAEQRTERVAFRVVRPRSIDIVVQTRATPGKRGKLPAGTMADGWSRGAEIERHKLPDGVSPEDLAIIVRLHSRWSSTHGADYSAANLRLLVDHPRVFSQDGELIAVSHKDARLVVKDAEGASEILVAVGDERVGPELLTRLVREDGAVIDDGDPRRIVITSVACEHLPLLSALLSVGGQIPKEGRDELIRALTPWENEPTVEVDAKLLGTQLAPAPVLVARLIPDTRDAASGAASGTASASGTAGGMLLSVVVRALPGAVAFSPSAGPERIVVARESERVFCVRDREAERALIGAFLAELPLERAMQEQEHVFRLAPIDVALDVVKALGECMQRGDVMVEWPMGKRMVVADAGAASMKVQVSGSPLSLHVRGEVSVDGGSMALVALLDAARSGARYVSLSADRFVAISNELRERALALSDASGIDGDHVVGGAGLAVALDELLAAGALVDGAGGDGNHSDIWQQWRERLKAASKVKDDPPPGFECELRPYQREGLRFLRRLVALGAGGVLADDMGLGKTLQAIGLLLERAKTGPALVVAPTSVCFNWARELERFAPGLRAHVLPEASDRAALIGRLKKRDVLIASYGLVVREERLFAEREFSTLILDEAQVIKNAASQRARAVKKLNVPVRIALTGTPLENHSGELWSIFSAVAPGLLPPLDEFRRRFQIPIDRGHDNARRRAFAQLIRPFLLRRTKTEVLPELPEKTEIVVRVELSEDERRHYQALRAVLKEKIESSDVEPQQKRVLILSALTRLRQVACHPALDATGRELAGQPSQKLIELMRLLSSLKENHHRVLVFSQFTRLLDLVEPLLEKDAVSFVRIDGTTNPAARARAVDVFQSGDADVFLLSLKAGGFGLNLTAADYVVHLDPWWNPAAEAQASDRAHRIGQTRPVTVYRLVAAGTLEEGVVAMQEQKRALFMSVLEGHEQGGGALDEEGLMALLEGAIEAMDASKGRGARETPGGRHAS